MIQPNQTQHGQLYLQPQSDPGRQPHRQTQTASWHQEILEAIFNESADAIFLVDPQTLLTLDCNPRAIALFEAHSKQDLIQIAGHTLQTQPFSSARLDEISAEMNQIGVWSQELEYRTLKGRTFWGNLAAKQIIVAGQAIRLVRITDVTARKAAEQQLTNSLREKELLLMEVHHRVKNNLHIISSLFDLQANQTQDQQALQVFADSQNRIQAMALIHEQLYQAREFGKVEFSDYIHRLANNLAFFYSDQIHSVQLVIDVEPIQINLETAITCGLLLNELVTNAFKHAFPGSQTGKVRIQLHQDANRRFHLTVEDNGVGLPQNLNWQTSKSLGLNLVRILVKQLKAKIEFAAPHQNGTQVQVSFAELNYSARV
jgi:PAS domain S-box-containing protein